MVPCYLQVPIKQAPGGDIYVKVDVDARPLARVTYKEEFKGTKGTQKIKAVGIAFSRHI